MRFVTLIPFQFWIWLLVLLFFFVAFGAKGLIAAVGIGLLLCL